MGAVSWVREIIDTALDGVPLEKDKIATEIENSIFAHLDIYQPARIDERCERCERCSYLESNFGIEFVNNMPIFRANITKTTFDVAQKIRKLPRGANS